MFAGRSATQIPFKLIFLTFQRLFRYARTRTETRYLSPYLRRAQNRNPNSQLLTHWKYFLVDQK